jgi:hypothetical protein
MLNRAALIVRPKQPYLDWAAGLDDSGLKPDPDDDQRPYTLYRASRVTKKQRKPLRTFMRRSSNGNSGRGIPMKKHGLRTGTSKRFRSGLMLSFILSSKISAIAR